MLNERIKREGWHDDVVRSALIALFGIVGQLEHYVKELERSARGESVLIGSTERVQRSFNQVMEQLRHGQDDQGG